MILQEVLANSAAIMSFAEGRRAVCMKAVTINGVQATLDDLIKEVKVGDVIQFGKRKTITITEDIVKVKRND